MNKYQNGKIYTIRSKNTDKYYIGSTVSKLCVRMADHVKHYKLYKLGKKKYVSSYDIMDKEEYYIELLENYPCNSREELRKREGELQRKYKNECINKHIAGRTPNEYNREVYHKTEKFKAYRKAYSQTEKSKAYQKAYDNTEKRKLYFKEYKKKRNATKLNCECGGLYSLNNKARHFKSTKHKNYIESL